MVDRIPKAKANQGRVQNSSLASTTKVQEGLNEVNKTAQKRQNTQFSPAKTTGLSHRGEQEVQDKYKKGFENFATFILQVLLDNPEGAQVSAKKGKRLNPEDLQYYDTASSVKLSLLRYARNAGGDFAERMKSFGEEGDARNAIGKLKDELTRVKNDEEAIRKELLSKEEENARLLKWAGERGTENAELKADLERTRAELAKLKGKIVGVASVGVQIDSPKDDSQALLYQQQIEQQKQELEQQKQELEQQEQELFRQKQLILEQEIKIQELKEQNKKKPDGSKPNPDDAALLLQEGLAKEKAERENAELRKLLEDMKDKAKASAELERQLEELRKKITEKELELVTLREVQLQDKARIKLLEEELARLKRAAEETESQMLKNLLEMMKKLQEELAAFHGEFKDFAARPVVKPSEDVVVGAPDSKGKPKAEVADRESQTETKVVDEGSQTEVQPDSGVAEEDEVDDDLSGSRPDLQGDLATLDKVDGNSELAVGDEEEEEGLEVEDVIEEGLAPDFDFDRLLERAAETVFKREEGQATKGQKRMLFKNFVSALDKVLRGRDPKSFTDQERLEKSSFEAMLAINFEQDGEEMSISFVDALQNKKFKAEFLEWAEEKVSAIADNSDKYNVAGHHHTISDGLECLAKHPRVAPPDASPSQPLSTEPIARMLGNLESIRGALR